MAAKSLDKELSDLKVTLRACLQGLVGLSKCNSKNGVDMEKVPNEYKEASGGEELDYKKFGYNSLYAFLMAMPDVVVLRFNPDSAHIDNLVSPVVDHTSFNSAHAIKNADKAKNSSFLAPLPPEEISRRRIEKSKFDKQLSSLSNKDVIMKLMLPADKNLTCQGLLETIPKYGCVANARITDNGRSAIVSFSNEKDASNVRLMTSIVLPDGRRVYPYRPPVNQSNKNKSKNNKGNRKGKGHNNHMSRTPNGPRSPVSPVNKFGMSTSNNNFSNQGGTPARFVQSPLRPLMPEPRLAAESKTTGNNIQIPEKKPLRPIISVHPVFNVLESIVNFLHSRYNGVWPRKAEDFPDYIDSLVVTSTVDACRFWAHCNRGNEFVEWEDNQRKLNREADAASAYSTLPVLYAIGAAKFEDNVYYRCIVTNANTFNHKLDVFYFDYGNSATIDGATFRHLPPKYLIIPPQAIAGRVAGLEVMDPDNLVMQEEGRQLLESLVRDKPLRATIIKKSMEQDLEIQFSELNTNDAARDKSINHLMGLTKYACSVNKDGIDEKISFLPECTITTINSRNEIYTRTAQQFSELKKYEEYINKTFVQRNHNVRFQTGYIVLCCITSSIQRAVILKFLPSRQFKARVEIRFIDYGNIAEVDLSTLYPLNVFDMKKIPHCTRLLLTGIRIDYSNPETKSFLMSKVKKSMKLKFCRRLSIDGIEGDLIDAETSLPLTRELVDRGFAVDPHTLSTDVSSTLSSDPSDLRKPSPKNEFPFEVNTAAGQATFSTPQSEPMQHQQHQMRPQAVSPKSISPSSQPEKCLLGSWPYSTRNQNQSPTSAFEKTSNSNTNRDSKSNTMFSSNNVKQENLNKGTTKYNVYQVPIPDVTEIDNEVINRSSPVSFDSGRSSCTPSPGPNTDATAQNIDVETVEIPSIYSPASEITIQQTDNSRPVVKTGPRLPDNPTIPWNGTIRFLGTEICIKNGHVNNDLLLKQNRYMEAKLKETEEIYNNLLMVSEMNSKERHSYYAHQRKEKLTQHIRNEVLETELIHAQLELSTIEQQRDELLHQL